MENLQNLTVEELETLRINIDNLIKEKTKSSEIYTFDFDETSDPRKATPYVATLVGIAENKFVREFKDLDRTRGRGEITVSGEYTAKEGEIVEIQTGGSWKNTYRNLHIVRNGELHCLCDYQESKKMTRIKWYLKGKISTAEELIEVIENL